MPFERGFKSWCERRSLEIRQLLGLEHADPLPAHDLAQHLRIRVRTTADFPALSDKARMALAKDTSGWSAVTLEYERAKLIVLNDTHSLGRQSSDLMHELAHHILEHRPSEVAVSQEGLLVLHNYNRSQEEEADWCAASLLLPRPALVFVKKHLPELEEAAQHFRVSLAMLRYRLHVTGVNYQFGR
ncbi:MAG: ImmA/IrrE family metallo-endopeptidase [Candidatus Accumulibacter sp. UW20]